MTAQFQYFDPARPLPGLEGLDAAFIADLHDFCANYGVEVCLVEGLRRMTVPSAVPALVTVTVPPSRMKNITVRKTPVDDYVSALCIMILDDEVHSYVQWDRRVTVMQVREAMAAVDAEMAHCRHLLTGRRQPVYSDQYAPPPLEVDRFFARKGKVVVLGVGADPEAVRHQFDRPDDLTIVPDAGGKGRHGLRRTAYHEDGSRVDKIAAKVLERYGVKSQADIDRMPRDRLQRMLAEIEAEIGKDG